METLACAFVDHLIDSRYVGPSVPNSVGLTKRNLMNIYNLVFIPHYARDSGRALDQYVSAEDLLTFMTSATPPLLSLAGDQVSAFPRHNIRLPVTRSSGGNGVRLSSAQAEAIRRMRLGHRPGITLVAGGQPGQDSGNLGALVNSVTRASANFVLLYGSQEAEAGSSELVTFPGFRSNATDIQPRLQLLVHNKLSVERLRVGSTELGCSIWVLVTEAGLLLDERGVRRDRLTLLGCVGRLGQGHEQILAAHVRELTARYGGRDIDVMLVMVAEARAVDINLVNNILGFPTSNIGGAVLTLVARDGVRYDIDEGDAICTLKVDKRYCPILDVGFRTSAELEAHKRTSKYNRARLYKYYQSCKAELLKSPHNLGLELEVIDADSGVEVGEGTETGVVTIIAKPNEAKKFKIKLRNIRAPEGDENRYPDQPKGIILDRFGMPKEDSVFQLSDEKGLINGTKLRLKHDKKLKVSVRASCGQIGHYRVPVIVGFYHEVHSDMQRDADGDMCHVLSHMAMELLLKVQTDEIRELRPVAPYREVRRARRWNVRGGRVQGHRLENDRSGDRLEMRLALDQYFINKTRGRLIYTNFQDCDSNNLEEKREYDKCLELFEMDLAPRNYMDKWHLLLHCEEKQLENDIRHYDMEGVTLNRSSNLFSLEVPGLEENRPSVMKGDRIFVRSSSDPQEREFEGFVHQIQERNVLIGFGGPFRQLHVRNMRFDVRFTLSRFPLRNMHRAVSLATDNLLRTLFPTVEMLPATQTALPQIRCYNQLIERNEKQLMAVKHIVAGSAGSVPYVVFGPPGTGKTVTIVEAIKQVAKLSGGCRILATAPSNTAADLLTERLMGHIVKRDILRMHAPSRLQNSIPARVKEVSNIAGDRYSFPRMEDLQGFKVIVTTLVTAGRLASAQFPPDHFTHIFIDEAGQAQEPETAIAMTGLLRGARGRVVMAGDPKQLGPVIRSSLAVRHGLNISLLERLMDLSMYQMQSQFEEYGGYDQRCITKLVKNFRSHHELLTVPKQLFYNNELEACADPMVTESCLVFDGLPTEAKRNKVPMIFHGVIGQDLKEESSPSFFNPEEVAIVVDYVKKLLQMRTNRIQAKEIGVITPYRRQVQKMRQLLRKNNLQEVTVGSTEEFQGQERKVIIVSTVRSSPEYVSTDNQYKLGFLKNPKRFNVAITRAKALLVVVGNPHILSQDADWCALLDWAVGRGCYTGAPYARETDGDMDRIEARLRRLLDEDGEGVSRMTQLEEPAWRSDQ